MGCTFKASALNFKEIANTGALCCVAAGPRGGTDSPSCVRDCSMDDGRPNWRTNSSFSPTPFRMWDCRLQSDGLAQGSHGVRLPGSSLSSHSRGETSNRYTNHQHSVSDGVLSYPSSPPDNIQPPRWTSPVQKFNLGEFAASTVTGSRTHTTWFPRSSERRYPVRATAASPSYGSPSSLSESSNWESTSRHPPSFHNRHFPNRRPYMSKAVYPLVFSNPVSDCETVADTADISSIGRFTPSEDRISPPYWPDNNLNMENKFHKTLTELQKLDMSPDPGTSSRRDGFRWSSASSFDMGFDGERFDFSEQIDVESVKSHINNVTDQKCGVCGKLLCQKSPWSSRRIMTGGDMPTAGVLSCSHVYHAECLEQVTPKTHSHDPPCPLCLKTMGSFEQSPSVSEPLQMALRSVRRNNKVAISDSGSLNHGNSNISKDRLKKNWHRVVPQWNEGGSSIKDRLKKHLLFKGKGSKDVFNTKVLHMIGSSSSSKEPI
ncbi:hypothetical protein ACFE04_024267 [Oxalis oulophora]